MHKRVIAFFATSIFIGGTSVQAKQPYNEQARIENAKELIAQNQAFQLHAKEVHANLESTEKEAKVLKGKATDLELKLNQQQAHMSPAELRAAQAQLAGDLDQFKIHARDYADHVQRFHL